MTNENKTLQILIQTIHMNLQELSETKRNFPNDFCIGQIYAYVECLEILQLCPAFCVFGLDYDIEKKFPL